MNKNLKVLSIITVLLVGLLGLSALASADSDLYDITQVKVNGITMSSSTVSDVELDDSTEVEVYLDGTGNSSTCPSGNVDDCDTDVRVKVWIGGYEYDDIEATSSEFTVEPGVSYKKTLTLDIPSDLDVSDSNDYTLYVEVYDSDDSERESYSLFAERTNHYLNIVDVLYDSSIDAGETSSVEVRVENLGDSKEEDIKVEASLGDLDSTAEYINELAAYEEDNEDEESSDSVMLQLSVPQGTESGYYDLTIKVSYNRGHDDVEETYKVWVNGEESGSSSSSESSSSDEAKTTISLSSTSIDGTEGKDSTFTLTFTNTGTESQTYTVTVNGEDQWASSDVSPSSVIVGAGESQEVTVTMSPKEASEGNQDFSIQILDTDGNLVKDISMTMSVDKDSSFFGNTGSALKVGFIILIVLIIIIGLIVAFRKLKDDDDEDPLEPKDGKTYY